MKLIASPLSSIDLLSIYQFFIPLGYGLMTQGRTYVKSWGKSTSYSYSYPHRISIRIHIVFVSTGREPSSGGNRAQFWRELCIISQNLFRLKILGLSVSVSVSLSSPLCLVSFACIQVRLSDNHSLDIFPIQVTNQTIAACIVTHIHIFVAVRLGNTILPAMDDREVTNEEEEPVGTLAEYIEEYEAEELVRTSTFIPLLKTSM